MICPSDILHIDIKDALEGFKNDPNYAQYVREEVMIAEAVQSERERIADWLQKQKDRNITDDASSIFLSLWISAIREGLPE